MWCELVTDFSRLEELSADWKRWVDQDDSASIFQSWEWVRAFWRAYGADYSLCTVAVHDGNRPSGVLPLMARDSKVAFLAAPESDYNDFICEEGRAVEVLEAAVDFMLGAPLKWSCAELDKVPENSKLFRIASAVSPPLRRRLKLVYRCPSPAIVVEQDRKTLDTLMGKEQLVRYQKKLQKLGSLSFRHVSTRKEAREHLAGFFRQHVARWAMARGTSQFARPEARAFYEALIEELDPLEQLKFGVLELNSRPIAYHFGFQHRGKLIWYKPTFDVNYWDYCPGDVLLRNLFQHVRDGGLCELDFTIGDEPFKYRFANHVRQNYVVYLERWPASIGCGLRSAVRFMQNEIRHRPHLKAELKRKLGVLRGVRLLDPAGAVQSCRRGLRSIYGWIRSSQEASLWASAGGDAPQTNGVSVSRATLDDLALLSAEFECFLSAGQMHQYRRLLKQGDRLFIARNPAGESFVILLGKRSEIEAFASGRDRTLRLSEPVLLILECWKAPEVSRKYLPAEVLHAVAAHLGGSELWVHNLGDDRLLKRMIQDSGMQLRHRLVRRTFLRPSGYTRMESIPDKDLPANPVARGVVCETTKHTADTSRPALRAGPPISSSERESISGSLQTDHLRYAPLPGVDRRLS